MSLKNRLSKRKKTLLTLVVIGSLLLPSTARSEDTVKECVAKCDAALKAQDQVISLKTQEIAAYKEVVAAQDTRIKALEKDKRSILKSPWLYFGLGLVLGVVIVK